LHQEKKTGSLETGILKAHTKDPSSKIKVSKASSDLERKKRKDEKEKKGSKGRGLARRYLGGREGRSQGTPGMKKIRQTFDSETLQKNALRPATGGRKILCPAPFLDEGGKASLSFGKRPGTFPLKKQGGGGNFYGRKKVKNNTHLGFR